MKIMTVEAFPFNANIIRTQGRTQGQFTVFHILPRLKPPSNRNKMWATYTILNVPVGIEKKNKEKKRKRFISQTYIKYYPFNLLQWTHFKGSVVTCGYQPSHGITRPQRLLNLHLPVSEQSKTFGGDRETSFTIDIKIHRFPQADPTHPILPMIFLNLKSHDQEIAGHHC